MPGLRTLMGILFALILSQAPEFSAQYAQRLGGAIDALQPIVERFDAAAAAQGLDRSAALARLEANPDALAGAAGRTQADAVERYDGLVAAKKALDGAAPALRPEVMLAHFDPALALGALAAFAPAAPLTIASGIHALFGFLFGFGGTHVTRRRLQKRKAKRREA